LEHTGSLTRKAEEEEDEEEEEEEEEEDLSHISISKSMISVFPLTSFSRIRVEDNTKKRIGIK
jgi:hypothetical protein